MKATQTHHQFAAQSAHRSAAGSLCLLLLLSLAWFQPAMAADAFDKTSLATGMAGLIDTLNGTVARSLAVIAVVGFGVAALVGRIEWSKAVVVIIGVGLIFSASALMRSLFGWGAI